MASCVVWVLKTFAPGCNSMSQIESKSKLKSALPTFPSTGWVSTFFSKFLNFLFLNSIGLPLVKVMNFSCPSSHPIDEHKLDQHLPSSKFRLQICNSNFSLIAQTKKLSKTFSSSSPLKHFSFHPNFDVHWVFLQLVALTKLFLYNSIAIEIKQQLLFVKLNNCTFARRKTPIKTGMRMQKLFRERFKSPHRRCRDLTSAVLLIKTNKLTLVVGRRKTGRTPNWVVIYRCEITTSW